ncbi:hypothetical protein [Eubacterium sp.]|nr:hypothetical protein [Eubacterium sp.]MDO5434668.1 hypothetical protein [Eubacterium sp.]
MENEKFSIFVWEKLIDRWAADTEGIDETKNKKADVILTSA